MAQTKKKFKTKKPQAKTKADVSQNKAIEKLSKKVEKLNKAPELKHSVPIYNSFYNEVSTNNFKRSNPKVFFINGIQRGNSHYNRIGDTVKITSLNIRGQIYMTSPANKAGVDIAVRLMLIKHREPEGVAMDLVSYVGLPAGRTGLFPKNSSSYTPNTWENIDLGVVASSFTAYKVLFNKVYHLKNNTTYFNSSTNYAEQVAGFINFNIDKKINSISDYSRGNAGTVADIEKNSYYFIAITDTTSDLSIELDTHFFFKDC